MLTGGSIIFFTYIGFDSVSTAAEECRNPQRDIPVGIIGTLVVCTILYIAVAVVLTGLVPWDSLVGNAAPVVNTLKKLSLQPGGANLHWVRLVILFGAMLGMISSILVFQMGQARVWFSMSRDGLFPIWFSRVHPKFRTPSAATWMAGFVVGIPAGMLDIGTLADVANIGTLFAFELVSVGVLDPSFSRAGSPSHIPRSRRRPHPAAQSGVLLPLDGRIADLQLALLFRLDADRPADLLPL